LGHTRVLVVAGVSLERYIWGTADRISREAPVIICRADARDATSGPKSVPRWCGHDIAGR
ncbi:MAG TPA: bifunctional heptose 7-phosphate kinase/heptose 1-phosphate adenyltransferase, partial [Gemmata sp.]|nr:bifunctional heptose 7-phosphate kinase/heptose 1-phosphate adenyltransferase [Gemmata sp.]